MKAPVESLILDLGGVILNIDYARTRDAFVSLGAREFDAVFTQSAQSGFFDAFDKGELSASQFRKELRVFLSKGVSDDQIDLAWNAMLLDFPIERIRFLRELSGRYPLFLLSNTNVIHMESFRNILAHTEGMIDFERIFNVCYYSCELGMRKPDTEIFEWVLQQNKLEANSTLFIDDSIQHVEGARRAGLNAEWLDLGKGDRLENRFSYLLMD